MELDTPTGEGTQSFTEETQRIAEEVKVEVEVEVEGRRSRKQGERNRRSAFSFFSDAQKPGLKPGRAVFLMLFGRSLLLLRRGLVDKPGESRFAASRVVRVNDAFLGRAIEATDGDAQMLASSFEIARGHGHAGALDGLAHAPAHLAVSFATF